MECWLSPDRRGANELARAALRRWRTALTASTFLAAVPLLLPVGGADAACSTTGTNQTCTNNATISGGAIGISDTGTLTLSNLPPGYIAGTSDGLNAAAVVVTTNSGTIAGNNSGIRAFTDATVTNNAGGTILGIGQGNLGAGDTAGIFAGTNATVTNSGTITGIDGIRSRNGAANVTNNAGAAIGGFGNAFGIVSSTNATVTNSGTITGFFQSGIFAGTNATVTNNAGGTITGGISGIQAFNGAANVTNFGTITGDNGIFSAAAGIVFNAGTVTGTGAAAIFFGTAGSTLTIAPTSIINGNVLAAAGTNTFQLGGTGTGTFDISALGPAQQYRNFSVLNKIDTSTWIVIGTGTYTGGTGILGGTLSVSSDGNLGGASGALTFNGGILQVTGVTFTSTPRTINWGAGGGGFDIADVGNNFTVSQNLGPSTGGLSKLGLGTLTLAGANTYSGATAVNAGTLQAGAVNALSNSSAFTVASGAVLDLNSFSQTIGSLAGAGNVTLGSSTLTAGGANTSTTFSGGISGTGGLTKAGTGMLTLAGANTYTGATTVNAGTLSVNGNIASSSGVIVNSGGTLGGTGTVAGTTINNGGTLAPGNSIGTITVNGNLTFNAGSAYRVEVSPTAADRTNVTGTATLAGTVYAAFQSGSYVRRNYTILSAAGGRSGQFDSLNTSGLGSGFATSLSYTATDVLLDFYAALGVGAGLNGNQTSVANSINGYFNNGGALPPAFVNLFGLTGANLANALTQLSGEAATGGQQGAFQLTNQFFGIMLDPFADGRDGIGGGPAIGFAPERAALPPDLALAYASVLKAPPGAAANAAATSFDKRWSMWGAAYGGANTSNGDPAVAGSHDLTARVYGFAGGFDYRVSRDTVVGFALAGGGTNWGLSDGLGGGKSDAFQAGVYGVTRSGPAYLAGALSYAAHWMSTDRFAFGSDRLTASFMGHSVGARIETGYRFTTAGVGVTPYGAVQGQLFYTPSYGETDMTGGGFGLSYDARTATAVRTELGARFDRQMPAAYGSTLVLRARAAWAYDHVSNPSLSASFHTLPGASFTVNGAAPVMNSALLSAGSELRLRNGWSVMAKVDGEIASRSNTYAGTAKLKYAW